jgi:hypothetical protein
VKVYVVLADYDYGGPETMQVVSDPSHIAPWLTDANAYELEVDGPPWPSPPSSPPPGAGPTSR